VSDDDTIFSTPAPRATLAQNFQIRSNELLRAQKIPHAQMVGCALYRRWTPRAAIFQNSNERTIESAKSPA